MDFIIKLVDFGSSLVHNHFTTHFNEKTLNLFENDDPKSTSFMMKSIFCAYASRMRLVNPENISTIHHSHPTSISIKYGFHHKTDGLWAFFVKMCTNALFLCTSMVNPEKYSNNPPISPD